MSHKNIPKISNTNIQIFKKMIQIRNRSLSDGNIEVPKSLGHIPKSAPHGLLGHTPDSASPDHDEFDDLVDQLEKSSLSENLPLNSAWTLYIDQIPATGSSLQDYTQNLKKIYKISTIQEFWQVYNNIPTPKYLPSMYSFHLMRGDRKPIWEDPAHENGGYWKMKCQKKYTNVVWKELLLAVIGEQFEENLMKDKILVDSGVIGSPPVIRYENLDNIAGLSVSTRDREDHFQIWNDNYQGAHNSTVVEKIKSQILPHVKFHNVYYKEHKTHEDFANTSGFKSGFKRPFVKRKFSHSFGNRNRK